MNLAKMAPFLRQISDDALLEEAKRRGMKMIDAKYQAVAMTGLWRLELFGPDMSLKDVRVKRNLVVNTGLNWLREFAFDSVTPTALVRMNRIAIGTGSTAASAADTTLQTESVRQVFTAATGYVAGGTGVCTVLTTFAAGVGTGAITEAGIINAAAAGELWNRAVFSAVNKGAGDTLKVTVAMTFTAV